MKHKNVEFTKIKSFELQLDEIPNVVRDLSNGKLTWLEVEQKYPKFEQQETTEVQ